MDPDLTDLAEYIGMTMEARSLPRQANEKTSEPAPAETTDEPLVTEFSKTWQKEFGK
jgi:hypothetical protein